MKRALIVALALAAGCAYTFDDEAPDLPLVGAPISTRDLPRLNRGPAQDATTIRGADNAIWLVVSEEQKVLRLVRLADPPAEEELKSDRVYIARRTLFIVEPDLSSKDAPTKLTLHLVGGPPGSQDAVFTLPAGEEFLVISGDAETFVWWPQRPDTREFEVIRRDGSFRRRIPVPDGVDPVNPVQFGGMFFDGRGERIFTRAEDGTTIAHSTRSELDVNLGKRPRRVGLDENQRALITCGEDGLRRVPYDGTQDLVLDEEPCASDLFWFYGDSVIYTGPDGALRKTPRDGTRAPTNVLDAGKRLLTIGPNEAYVYSKDPSSRFVGGAGDGWYGDWRFMERGRAPRFSRDQKRILFLESAARGNGVGILTTADLDGAPRPLAKNVSQFDELTDGRILAISNYAFYGTHNRLIAVDPDKNEARFLAESTSGYSFIPGTNDLLLDLVTGLSGYDIVRLSLPPKDL